MFMFISKKQNVVLAFLPVHYFNLGLNTFVLRFTWIDYSQKRAPNFVSIASLF